MKNYNNNLKKLLGIISVVAIVCSNIVFAKDIKSENSIVLAKLECFTSASAEGWSNIACWKGEHEELLNMWCFECSSCTQKAIHPIGSDVCNQ